MLRLDWPAAEYEQGVDGGTIWIPITDAPEDEAWWTAFRETLAIHESETRSQLWRRLDVSEAEVVLHGVPEQVDPSDVRRRVEEYLENAAKSADQGVARAQARDHPDDVGDEARRIRAASEFQRRLRETDG